MENGTSTSSISSLRAVRRICSGDSGWRGTHSSTSTSWRSGQLIVISIYSHTLKSLHASALPWCLIGEVKLLSLPSLPLFCWVCVSLFACRAAGRNTPTNTPTYTTDAFWLHFLFTYSLQGYSCGQSFTYSHHGHGCNGIIGLSIIYLDFFFWGRIIIQRIYSFFKNIDILDLLETG